MSITELEEMVGIEEKNKVECPYYGEDGTCNTCEIGLSYERCEELYEVYLLNKVVDDTSENLRKTNQKDVEK